MQLMDTAVDQFRVGATSFQQQLDALIASVNAERTTLAEGKEQLRRERQAYEEEKQRVSQVCLLLGSASSTACLSVGASGEPYITAGVLRERASSSQRRRCQFHHYTDYPAKCTCSLSLCSNVQWASHTESRPGK